MAVVTMRSEVRPAPARGLTLVEIMVAMTIFALILVGIVPMMVQAIAHNRQARRTLEARSVLNSYTELMKTEPATSFAIGTSAPVTIGQYRIQRVVTADTLNFRRVQLTMRWTVDTTVMYTRETRVAIQ